MIVYLYDPMVMCTQFVS